MIKVGDPCWVFDINRRVYAKDKAGRSVGGPIWREHWVKREVVGETRVSWVIGTPGYLHTDMKVPKREALTHLFVEFSEQRLEQRAWAARNQHHIVDAMRRIDDYELLQKLAALIGYKEQP